MSRQGPCLPHCYTCPAYTVGLSYVCIAYTLACVLYLFMTYHMETPLRNSLNDEQRRIRDESVRRRGRIFIAAFACSAGALLLLRPYRLR